MLNILLQIFFFSTLSLDKKRCFWYICRYWLFGEKEQKGTGDSKRIRGWFPHLCAIEVIENNIYGSNGPYKDN